MMIKIEFPGDNLDAAKHLGAALTALGKGAGTQDNDGYVEPGHDEAGYQKYLMAEHENFDVFKNEALDKIAIAFDLDPEAMRAVLDADAVINTGADAAKTKTIDNTAIQTAGAADNARLDEHGVPFNPAMCGVAAIPFYASGPNAGQWKKLRGVDQAEYDTWYAEAKPPAQPAGDAEPVNTAGAFQPDDSGVADPAVPHDAGTLMAWVSSMQGAGRLTQDQVNSAYTQAELVMPDIFPTDANTPDVIAERVGDLYAILSAWA